MTEKTINAAQADVNAMRALKLLEERLRGETIPLISYGGYRIERNGGDLNITRIPEVEYVPCGFCARPVKLTAYACECGWKVAS